MKLSKPEEMDELDESTEESADVEPPESADVEVFGTEMETGAAVELVADAVEDPDGYGIASSLKLEELEEKIEKQREAIAELAEAVEILSENQGQIAQGSTDADGTVALDEERLGGIYDPTGEF